MKNLIKITAVLISLVILLSVFTVSAYAESGMLIRGSFNFDYSNAMAEYINDYREQNGLKKLDNDLSLVEPAMIRAAECTVNFSHVRPNGTACTTAFYWEEAVAENIARGFSGPKEATDAYYNSEGHRKNMLGDYTRMGVGVFVDDSGVIYWIHLFTRGETKQTYKEKGNRSVILNIATDSDDETTVIYEDGMPAPSKKASEYEKSTAPEIASVKLSKTVFEYNGRKQAPEVVAKDKNGKIVPEKYYNVVLPSRHTLYGFYKIKVIPKYGGKTLIKSFKIIPKSTSISKLIKSKKTVTVRWRSVASSTTGVKLCYASNKNFTKEKKTLTFLRTKTTKSITGLKNGKTYYFKLRAYKKNGDDIIYSTWSSVKKIKK